MKEDINRFEFEGRVVKDPYIVQEHNMCKVTIVTDRWGFERGNYDVKKKFSTFVSITFFSNEYFRVLEQDLKKGDRINVVGRIDIYSKKLDDGTWEEKVSFVCSEFRLIERAKR